MSYDDHAAVIAMLHEDQEAECDLREEIDDIIHFLHHPQGQWEPSIWSEYDGRPRYTFDQCKPAIAKVWAEMAANEYSASTQPVGGGATEETSNTIDGLMRNIYNISSFDDVSTKAGKRMIATGFAAWRLVAKYAGEYCFYQDIMIEPISNAHRRVWFQAGSELQTRADANHVHVFGNMNRKAAEKKWKRAVKSLNDDRTTDAYTDKPSDTVIVSEILYKKPAKKMIYLMPDDSVYDEKGLEAEGMTEDDAVDSREIEYTRVFSRKYDNEDWLEDEKETVWHELPVIPEYANFDVSEDGKVTYEGIVRPVMDSQRVFNYAESRKVEESVLAPRKKIFMDDRVAEGYVNDLANLNRDPRAVQLLNGKGIDQSKMPIYESGGPAPNPAVSEVSDSMIRNMQLSLGLPNELEIAASTKKDSDFRFNQRSSMGQVGTFEYYRGHKVALEHTAKVALGAIPTVYDTPRKVRIVDEANQSSEVSINGYDEEGKRLNDLTIGKYDVCIKIGKDFQSRQADANSAILELGSIIPEVVMRNSDIIASNMDAPGMRTVADRERAYLLKQGVIPEDQFTDQEKQKLMAAQQQPQQPDAGTLIAQAEVQKAEVQAQEAQFKALEAQAKLELQQVKQQTEASEKAMRIELEQQKQQMEELYKLIQGAEILAKIDQMNSASPELSSQNQLINQNQGEV